MPGKCVDKYWHALWRCTVEYTPDHTLNHSVDHTLNCIYNHILDHTINHSTTLLTTPLATQPHYWYPSGPQFQPHHGPHAQSRPWPHTDPHLDHTCICTVTSSWSMARFFGRLWRSSSRRRWRAFSSSFKKRISSVRINISSSPVRSIWSERDRGHLKVCQQSWAEEQIWATLKVIRHCEFCVAFFLIILQKF